MSIFWQIFVILLLWCWRVTVYDCFKHSHACLLQLIKCCTDGETEPKENVNRERVLCQVLWKKKKENYWTPITGFLRINRNEILALAILKKIEKWPSKNVHLPTPHIYGMVNTDILFSLTFGKPVTKILVLLHISYTIILLTLICFHSILINLF